MERYSAERYCLGDVEENVEIVRPVDDGLPNRGDGLIVGVLGLA